MPPVATESELLTPPIIDDGELAGAVSRWSEDYALESRDAWAAQVAMYGEDHVPTYGYDPGLVVGPQPLSGPDAMVRHHRRTVKTRNVQENRWDVTMEDLTPQEDMFLHLLLRKSPEFRAIRAYYVGDHIVDILRGKRAGYTMTYPDGQGGRRSVYLQQHWLRRQAGKRLLEYIL